MAAAKNTRAQARPWQRIRGGRVCTAAEAESEWQLCVLGGEVIGFEGQVTEVWAANEFKQQGEVA